jgi:hypothetical protein
MYNEYCDEHDIFRWLRCCSGRVATSKNKNEIKKSTDETHETTLLFENDFKQINSKNNDYENNNESPKSLFNIYWERYSIFVKTPKVHYIYEFIFYVIFLLLFSYTLLCKLNYYEIYNANTIKSYSNSSDYTKNKTDNNQIEYEANNYNEYSLANETTRSNEKQIVMPSLFEYVLIIWILLFIIDEFYQVVLIFLI